MTSERAEAIALWRYALIAEAVSPRLTAAERGRLSRVIATRPHVDSDGRPCAVSRTTVDRWLRAYRTRGLDGLRPTIRSDSGAVRRHPTLFDEAAALRREHPARSAAQIADMIELRHGVRIAPRTIRERFQNQGLTRAALAAPGKQYGRYEASRPNERWIGDVLTGPWVPHPRVSGSRRAKLFLLVDDHSRLLVFGRWVNDENARAGQEVLRTAIEKRGAPDVLYVDNGSPYIAAPLARTCAVLGIHLIHSKPYSPQGRGKQERLNRYIRERFLLEAEAAGITDLAEFNDRFTAWVEQVCNCRVHAETGQTPIARYLAGGTMPSVDHVLINEAFRWSALRTVSRTAMVSLEGNRYQVDPSLVGRRVELRYNPEAMSIVTVHDGEHPAGVATPFVLGQHTHPAVPQAAQSPAKPTGIDYLGQVMARHDERTEGSISFRNLASSDNNNDTEDHQ